MADICIQISKENAIITTDAEGNEVIDWIPAYRAAAIEIQQLNGALIASGLDPIEVNPDAVKWVAEKIIDVLDPVIEGQGPTGHQEVIPAHYEGQLESFIGVYCSPPATYTGPLGTDEGIVTIRTMAYSFIKASMLYQFGAPQSFDLFFDRPSTAGTIQ